MQLKNCEYSQINVNLRMRTHRQETCASFRASFYYYVLTSYCSNIALQHINVENCSKTCANLLPVYHKLKTYNTDGPHVKFSGAL